MVRILHTSDVQLDAPFHLIVAPSGRGKTACVIDAVRALPPLTPARVLVPDHVEAAALLRRLASLLCRQRSLDQICFEHYNACMRPACSV